MGFLPKDEGARRAILGIASVAFGMIMREVANRRRAARPVPQPDPPIPAAPEPAPEIVIRLVRPIPPKPKPPKPKPPTPKTSPMTRPITWGVWTTYLILRLVLAGLTVILLEISSTMQSRLYLYLAVLSTIGALLIPYGKPRQRRNPDNIAGIATICGVALAVAIWPWFYYATATAPVIPVPVLATRSFSISPNYVGRGCVGLLDNHQNLWVINQAARGSIQDNRITLYQTTFGWTSERAPTQSPSPLFNTPHLNQVAYSLTQAGAPTPGCRIYNAPRG